MKRSIKIAAVLAVGVCFAFALPKTNEPKHINVVIDAGHGGKDHGATHDTFTEKQIVNDVANKIQQLNKDRDVVIHFTRVSDNFISLEERVEAINAIKPDLVLSLHVNYTDKSPRSGMEFFVCDSAKEAKKSVEFAEKLSDRFEAKNFKVADVKSAKFYILNKSEAPAVTVELGYLSNEQDRSYLTNEKKQDEIAAIMLDFIKEMK